MRATASVIGMSMPFSAATPEATLDAIRAGFADTSADSAADDADAARVAP